MSFPSAPQTLSSFRCSNHPDREGVGICVACRGVVCVECTTKIDRMNYCIRCLQAANAAAVTVRPEDPRRDAVLGIPLTIGAFILSVAAFWLLGFLLALFRSGAGGGVTGS
jgi:hypothetical protein